MTTLSLPVTVEKFATREAWLEARQTYGIGSSDVPAILGLSRFQSPLALYHQKLGITIEHPRTAEQRKWGQLLEEPIARAYADETKRIVVNPNEEGDYSIMRSIPHPFMLASVDRYVLPRTPDAEPHGVPPPADGMGILEVKNAHLFMADQWGPENNNEPPVEYQVQLQHQLAVSEAQWGSIAALIGGSMFVWTDLARDEALIKTLIEIESDFMRRLELREPPSADGSESTRQVLKALYPKDDGTSITLPAEALEWSDALQTAKTQGKLAKAEEDKYSNLLRQALGESTYGLLPDGTSYSHKWQKRKEFVSPEAEFRVLRYHQGKK